MFRQRLWVWEKDHRGKEPLSSAHTSINCHNGLSLLIFTLIMWLKYFWSSISTAVILSSPLSHTIPCGRKSLGAVHASGVESDSLPSWGASTFMKPLEFLCKRDSSICSIICLCGYGLGWPLCSLDVHSCFLSTFWLYGTKDTPGSSCVFLTLAPESTISSFYWKAVLGIKI